MFWLISRVLLVLSVFAAGWVWVRLGLSRARRSRREAAEAVADFARHRDRLAEDFRAAAQATGKPRGLHWTRCQLAEAAPTLARDTATGELVALCGVTIAFAAVPGGDMEEVAAVGDLRDATAVFHWRDSRWATDGRAVFNLSPLQTLDRYQASLTPVEGVSRSAPGQ